MTTAILEEELTQIDVQIEKAVKRRAALEEELRVVDAELETFATERQRFDALKKVLSALDKLGELKAGDLFWAGLAEQQNADVHIKRAKNRVALFEGDISGILEKKATLQGEINRCLDELAYLQEEVRDAYERDERREEEYFVDREISPVPNHTMAMPGDKNSESERRFRRSLLLALLFYILFGAVIRLWVLPPPERPVVTEVPERLVSMLRREPPKPEREPEQRKEERKPEKNQQKVPEKQHEEQPKVVASETETARSKAESTGVLAFKESFKGMLDEAPAARLGTEARINNQAVAAAGQARPNRSLVAMQSAGGYSGGISNSGISRDIGSGNGSRIGGVGFSRVESTVAGQAGESRPLSSGPGPGRTDEEIQIVFDRYKAALYRLYNAELRKDPTLRGKMILRITIEPGGEVSSCTVQSNDLASEDLVSQVVERVKKFNFGPKEKVSRITILYPIDFLPAV
ncbi:MAG TPA: AgmX/PglI C-terminal domain-containing protein [Nitrospirota bacterium]|nr:AgmX/PglI C-terminal domain-containing protein [Nitrospirota bacterium]